MNPPIRRATPVLIALALSVLFHFSMVSIFSIVIWVPRVPMRYASLEVVSHQAPPPPPRTPRRPVLKLHMPKFLQEEAPPPALTLPQIELPRLELPNLLEEPNKGDSLQIRQQFNEFFEEKTPNTPDSWAVFTNELRDFGRTLTGMPAVQPTETETAPVRVGNVAPGFEIEITWMSEPRTRRLLFSPPIERLWQLDAARLREPLTFVFAVDPDGKVTRVQSPVADDAGVAAELQEALGQYRFEALPPGEAREQMATLVLYAEARAE